MMETSTLLDPVENLTRGPPDPWGPGEEEEEEGEPGGRALRALVGGVLLLLIVSTLLGNTLVCAAVLRFRPLRCKVTNVFVVSLAVSDLLLALLVMPPEAVTTVTGRWLLGGFCSVWIACDIMCSTASILNLVVISLDRYWAIASPFRYERRMTHRVAFLLVGALWGLSLLISFVPVHLDWHRAAEEGAGGAPGPAEGGGGNWTGGPGPSDAAAAADICVANLSKTYAIVSSLVSFYVPVGVMLATYTRIYRIAQTQIRRIAALERVAGRGGGARGGGARDLRTSFRRETKVLKTLSVIMGVFVGCWSPFFLLNTTLPFCQPACVSDTTFTVAAWFGWANSSLNPVIYAFNADFRRAFSTLLGCGGMASSTAVEALNLSNELVSCPPDTALQPDTALPPGTALPPDTAVHRDAALPPGTALHRDTALPRDSPLHPYSTAGPPTCSASPASLGSASCHRRKDRLPLSALPPPPGPSPPGTPWGGPEE